MSSLFTEFLAAIVEEVTGAIGAVIQDWEGESVDQFGHIDDMDLSINAAQWGLLWRLFRYQILDDRINSSKEILIETSKQKILITTLYEDYYLVLIMKKHTSLSEAMKVISSVIVQIKDEMGL
ncbi:MAG: hypothetical protein JXR95_15520 [Deltaproteobacteria bacterium]|nr:hypothetical protein [Deltaproteobacteria bacterium]